MIYHGNDRFKQTLLRPLFRKRRNCQLYEWRRSRQSGGTVHGVGGGDANILYADNGPAESATTFGGGTLTITTDDLLPEPAAAILGLTLQAVSEKTDVKELVFGEGQSIPYVGFGVVVKKQQSGATKWMGLVYPKVQFQNPGISATTQGESIEWQTKELTATILRDDTAEHNWCRYAIFDTETDAVSYIKSLLSITGGVSA